MTEGDDRLIGWPLPIEMSAAAALAYLCLWSLPVPQGALVAVKGAGVGLLAVHAATQARSPDGWLLAALLGFGALGDMLLEIAFNWGVAAFLAGHLAAIPLYLRDRPKRVTLTRWVLAVGLMLVGILGVAFGLGGGGLLIPASVLGLCVMAAAAIVSRFPLRLTGLGAILFVVSGALIAARMELGLAGSAYVATGCAIWVLYYVGQLLICVGVLAVTAPEPRAAPPSAR